MNAIRKACPFFLFICSLGWSEAEVKPETFIYKEVEGLPIQLDCYRNTETDRLPVVVWIHGGALIGGKRESIKQEQLELYLDSGYAVVSIDYRLAPESKLPEIISDVHGCTHLGPGGGAEGDRD